jgi:hypothetical protein
MKKKKNAVTIIETLITLLAITIMISGPIGFVVKSFEYSSFIRDKTFATFFAQEGLELITALRNGNTDIEFKNAINNCLNTECLIDFDFVENNPNPQITLSPCTGVSCILYKNPAEIDSLYRQNIAYSESSDYYRTITFTLQTNGSYNVKVRVYTIFSNGYLPIDVTLEKNIFLFNKI